MELAIAQARLSINEPGRESPWVGAVVVGTDGVLIDKAYRGELGLGEHAEYTLLEKKLKTATLAGSTLYTTLEPCTERNDPKRPCVHRVIERKFKRVFIGTLDPNRAVLGVGVLELRDAGIAVEFFDDDLMSELEELNREFNRLHRNPGPKASQVDTAGSIKPTSSSSSAADSQQSLSITAVPAPRSTLASTVTADWSTNPSPDEVARRAREVENDPSKWTLVEGYPPGTGYSPNLYGATTPVRLPLRRASLIVRRIDETSVGIFNTGPGDACDIRMSVTAGAVQLGEQQQWQYLEARKGIRVPMRAEHAPFQTVLKVLVEWEDTEEKRNRHEGHIPADS